MTNFTFPMKQNTVKILRINICICLCMSMIASYAHAGISFERFSLHNPFRANQREDPVPESLNGEVAKKERTGFLKVVKFVSPFQQMSEAHSRHAVDYVLSPNTVKLDNGTSVHLIGLASYAEMAQFDAQYGFPLRSVSDTVMDFMRAYLEDKKVTVQYDDTMPCDEHGYPCGYIYYGRELINATFLKYGYALLSEKDVSSKYRLLKQCQSLAILKRSGIWA